MNNPALSADNWQAYLHLRLRAGEDKTRLLPIKRYGPLSVQRPFYPEKECCHVYVLHPPGGVVGGDSLELKLECEQRSKALLTTPGANKFYLSAGSNAHLQQKIDVHDNATLEYLPQANIYFPGSKVVAKTTLNLSEHCDVIFWEKHCFGRPVNNEFYASGKVITELQLRIEQKLIFSEKQRIDASEINRLSGLRGNPVSGSLLVYSNRLSQSLLERLRKISPRAGISGITLMQDNLMIARYMGASTNDIDSYFVQLWELLRPHVLQIPVCRPRIWNT